MSDRELLELAAKAAGVNVTRWMKHSEAFLIPDMKEGIGESWNPLTDDGDAFRLAVKLCLFNGSQMYHYRALERFSGPQTDELICTRRAIVRAAAEIGRAMP